MKIAINTKALGEDLDLTPLARLGDCKFFGEVTREELFSICKDVDALIVNKLEVDAELLDRCPGIKYVGTFATGYNVVDIEACRKRGVTVCNAPDYSTRAVSQHTFALLLALYGKTGDYSASVKAGDWIKSKTFCYFPYPTHEIYGKKFGTRTINNSTEFADCLLDAAKVAVIPGVAFGADECVRLSYSLSMKDMLEGLDRIHAFLMSLE